MNSLDYLIQEIFNFTNDLSKLTDTYNIKSYAARAVPYVSRVQYNNNTTIVWFTDGTKVVVKLSDNDTYDRKTAIVYAICKRLFSKVKSDGTLDSTGFGTYLQKLADSGIDQNNEAEIKAKRKAQAEMNRIKQNAEHETAFNRKVKARVEQMKIERAAEAEYNKSKTVLNETTTVETKPTSTNTKDTTYTNTTDTVYVRPNKPFSQFTQEEKRAYWRESKKNSKK